MIDNFVRKSLCTILSLLLFSPIFAQSKAEATLTIDKISTAKKGSWLVLAYHIQNITDSINFYKVQMNDFCDGLAYLSITDYGTDNYENYFPCIAKIQLDQVNLNKGNLILIPKNGIYSSVIKIRIQDISPKFLVKRKHNFRLSFNYNNIITNSLVKYFREKLVSEKYIF